MSPLAVSSVFSLSTCAYVCACDASSYARSLWTQYLTNHFWEFHIYNLGTFRNKDELIMFWG